MPSNSPRTTAKQKSKEVQYIIKSASNKDGAKSWVLKCHESDKLTFGPAIPFSGRDRKQSSQYSGYALRVYRRAKLVACFAGVVSFRRHDITTHIIDDGAEDFYPMPSTTDELEDEIF